MVFQLYDCMHKLRLSEVRKKSLLFYKCYISQYRENLSSYRANSGPLVEGKSKFSQLCLNYLTTKKQTTKFSPANFQKRKKIKFKLYHIESSKIRGQTV